MPTTDDAEATTATAAAAAAAEVAEVATEEESRRPGQENRVVLSLSDDERKQERELLARCREQERDRDIADLVSRFCASRSQGTWSVRREEHRLGSCRRVLAEEGEGEGESLDVWYGRRWAVVVHEEGEGDDSRKRVFPGIGAAENHLFEDRFEDRFDLLRDADSIGSSSSPSVT
jgi:hypothetical protein